MTPPESPGPALAPPTPGDLEVVDYPRKRVHSSVDGIRLVSFVAVLTLLFAFGVFARYTSVGLNADLDNVIAVVPGLLVNILSVVGAVVALAMPIAMLVRGFARGEGRRLGEALLAGVFTIIIVASLSGILNGLPDSRLFHALTLGLPDGGHTAPLDPYIAAWLTLGGLTGIENDRKWRTLFVLSVSLYGVSAFAARQSSLLTLLISGLIGATVAAAVRYFVGIINERPDATRIAAVLVDHDLPLRRIQQIRDPSSTAPRRYLATTTDGRGLYLDVLDRDNVAAGWASRLFESLRVRSDLASDPDLSIESAAQNRGLLALSAAAVGAATPAFLAGAPCGPNAIVLAYEAQPRATLVNAEPPATDDQIRQIWSSIVRLHRGGVAYSGLSAERIRVRPSGEVVLPIMRDGRAFASDIRIRLDNAQVLAATAQLVGASRAVLVAREFLPDAELSAAVAVLQPVAMNAETRKWLKSNHSVIEDVRTEVQGVTELPTPDLYRVERFQLRTVVTIVAVIVAIWLLVGQLGSVDLATVFKDANWGWAVPALVASVVTYFAAGWGLLGYVRERLPYLRTVAAQLAASFTGFVTPPAVGGLALNVRYLQKAGLSTPAAAASVGLNQLVNALIHLLLLTIFAAASGTATDHHLPIPGWAFIVLAGLAAALAIAFAVPVTRRLFLVKIMPTVRDVLPRLLDLISRPAKLAQALSGSVLLNAAYIACLWFAVRAFNGHVDVVGVAIVYLAGAVIGSAAPTPGGLGAIEAAMSSGLIAAGMPGASAISAVLLFRIATFWLPVPAGSLALNLLQRRDAI